MLRRMAGTELRIGILGAARIAPMALVRPARETPGALIRAVAARDPERARAFATKHGIPVCHGDYEALLADPELDAVYNPLPNGLHGIWTMRALRAGKHVLCEKPFTANAEEARAVAAVARETGRFVMEAFHWRYHPLASRMLEILASGELGELRHVEAHLCAPILNTRDIRYRLELAGGAGMDMGCYVLHFVRTFAGGEPRVVSARPTLLAPGVDRAMEIELALPGGATGRAVCSMLSWRVLDVSGRVEGTRGRMRILNPWAPHLFHRLRVETHGGTRSERIAGPSTYACQLAAFVRAVREGVPVPTGADDAIANMALVDAAYAAAGLARREPSAATVSAPSPAR
jgi:predicted dehydrogenase